MSNSPIVDIMNGIVEAADRDTPSKITYKDFMEADKDSSPYDIFNTYEMAALEHVFIVNKIVKQKYGITRMSDDLYHFILEFPSYIKSLGSQIERDEGSSCCVDKAWSRALKRFDELVKQNQEDS